jgi:hypothetical protein
MSHEVTLPALGESVTEGTVTRWLKNVGDTVAVDEPLVEISTDKVDTEIPSPVAGVIEEILVAEDDTVECWFAWVTVAAQQPPQLRPLLQKLQLLSLHQQLQLRHPNLWHLLLRRPLQLPRLHPQLLLLLQ